MNVSTGFKKEVNIIGYEVNQGRSDKCKSEKNPNGDYYIAKFWYTDEVDTDKETYTAHGNIGRYFTTGRDASEQLIAEFRECGELHATIAGTFGKNGELRVYNINTN